MRWHSTMLLTLLACLLQPLMTHAYVALMTEGWGRGRLLRSCDAGATWQPMIECYINLQQVVTPTPFTAVAVGDNGTIIVANMAPPTLNANLNSSNLTTVASAFVHEYTGSYLTRVQATGTEPPALSVWTSDSLPYFYAIVTPVITADLLAVIFLNSSVGLAGGTAGMLLLTSDGGLSWNQISSNIIRDINAITFYQTSPSTWLIIACANVGTIISSSDVGASWSIAPSATSNNLYDVTLLDATRAYACGDVGTLIQSLDGGVSWLALSSLSSAASGFSKRSLYSIRYDSALDVLYVAGSQNTLLMSLDLGVTFEPVATLHNAANVSSIERYDAVYLASSVRAFAARSQVYTQINGTSSSSAWFASDLIDINSISSLSLMEAGVLSVMPMMFNLSSFSGIDLTFNFTLTNTGTERLSIQGLIINDPLIIGKLANFTLWPGQSSPSIFFTYEASALSDTVVATYFTSFEIWCDTPQQFVTLELSAAIVPQPASSSSSFLSRYWWALALAFSVLAALTFIFVRRRVKYIKKYNRRVRYEDEKISFWGCWIIAPRIEHDSDSEFWSDEEQEELSEMEEEEEDDLGSEDEDDEPDSMFDKSTARDYEEKTIHRTNRLSETGIRARITRQLSAKITRQISMTSSHSHRGHSGNDEADDEDTDSSISDQDFNANEHLNRTVRVRRIKNH